VALAADDDQDVAVAERHPGRREVDRAGEDVGLLADVLDRVLGELGEHLVDPQALGGELTFEVGDGEHAAPEHLTPADRDGAVVGDRH
jgi:hypothetical protein